MSVAWDVGHATTTMFSFWTLHFSAWTFQKVQPRQSSVTGAHCYSQQAILQPLFVTPLSLFINATKKKKDFFVFILDSEEHHGLENINLCRCLSFLGEREEENSGVILLGFLKMIWYYQMLPLPGHLWVAMFYKTKQMH